MEGLWLPSNVQCYLRASEFSHVSTSHRFIDQHKSEITLVCRIYFNAGIIKARAHGRTDARTDGRTHTRERAHTYVHTLALVRTHAHTHTHTHTA